MKFVVYFGVAGDLRRLGHDRRLLLISLDRAAEGYRAVNRDDLDVLGLGGKLIVFHQRPADIPGRLEIRGFVGLVDGSEGLVIAVTLILGAVIDGDLVRSRLREGETRAERNNLGACE